LDRHPGQSRSVSLLLQRSLHPAAEVFRRVDGVDHVPPDAGIKRDGLKSRQMVKRERFKTDVLAFEGGSLHKERVAHTVGK